MNEVISIDEKIRLVSQDAKIVTKHKRGGVPYKTVSHDDVLAMIKPILLDHRLIATPEVEGFTVTQDGNRTCVQFNLAIQCTEMPMNKRLIPTFGYGVDTGDKGPGKAYSYAYKYALLKGFMLETGDDPDTVPHQEHRRKTAVNSNQVKGDRDVTKEPF